MLVKILVFEVMICWIEKKKFEKMLTAIQQAYSDTVQKPKKLKSDNKTKSATYRQLMGNKFTYINILSLYKLYGLIDES